MHVLDANINVDFILLLFPPKCSFLPVKISYSIAFALCASNWRVFFQSFGMSAHSALPLRRHASVGDCQYCSCVCSQQSMTSSKETTNCISPNPGPNTVLHICLMSCKCLLNKKGSKWKINKQTLSFSGTNLKNIQIFSTISSSGGLLGFSHVCGNGQENKFRDVRKVLMGLASEMPSCRTAGSVLPESQVGNDSRQYATRSKQPAWLNL